MRTALLCLMVLLQACATSGALNVARDQFRHGSAREALQTLSEADVSRRDRLLLYLDRGLVAQAAGEFETSIAAFDSALRLVDELDYVSLRDQSSALLTSDWATRYSGEYSERLWIHTFQMLNFLLIDEPQGAAVEARRAAAVYEEHGEVLKQDVFTRALMALSFAAAGQNDSAGVEYRRLEEDFGTSLQQPLARDQSELVLFVASGFIEPKLPGDLFIDINARISFPYYPESYSSPPVIRILDESESLPIIRSDTQLLRISSDSLAERGKRIAARQALRIAAKYSVSDAIAEQDALAGNIARLIFLAIEQADTRSWETLPAWLTLVRTQLPPGSHTLQLQVSGDELTPGRVTQRRTLELELSPGERHFKLIRLGINVD
ncbi:hypothetical protein ACUNV4_25540 [Granulosicoccus sp. 3-233]|uniref:hypothetical protein n=1 Tax=Granulosicoccus sp. 3-233 TaxID=3417969 RepID=UPI003D3333E4